MAGLGPAIHEFLHFQSNSWMPRPSLGMTLEIVRCSALGSNLDLIIFRPAIWNCSGRSSRPWGPGAAVASVPWHGDAAPADRNPQAAVGRKPTAVLARRFCSRPRGVDRMPPAVAGRAFPHRPGRPDDAGRRGPVSRPARGDRSPPRSKGPGSCRPSARRLRQNASRPPSRVSVLRRGISLPEAACTDGQPSDSRWPSSSVIQASTWRYRPLPVELSRHPSQAWADTDHNIRFTHICQDILRFYTQTKASARPRAARLMPIHRLIGGARC